MTVICTSTHTQCTLHFVMHSMSWWTRSPLSGANPNRNGNGVKWRLAAFNDDDNDVDPFVVGQAGSLTELSAIILNLIIQCQCGKKPINYRPVKRFRIVANRAGGV